MRTGPSHRLTPAPTVDAFLASPMDAYVVGAHYLYFQAGPALTGYMVWGTPNVDDLDALERLFLTSNARLGKHPSLVDGRALSAVPVLMFERMAAYVRTHRDALRTSLTKLALVYGADISGALAAGFFTVVEPPYDVGHHGSLEAALGWLGAPHRESLAAELEAYRDAASARPDLLRRLEAVAVGALPEPDEERVARALGLSKRSLQRRLAAYGTTFQTEVTRVRAARAVLLLESTDATIGSIADEVGCSSQSRLAALVKKLTGATPTELRARRPR